MPVILTNREEIEQWLTAPPNDALALQRPLADDALRIVARGKKEDGQERHRFLDAAQLRLSGRQLSSWKRPNATTVVGPRPEKAPATHRNPLAADAAVGRFARIPRDRRNREFAKPRWPGTKWT